MATHHQVYNRPQLYDYVFRRNVDREVDFLIRASERVGAGVPDSLVDIACGPGYHARAAARRGLLAFGTDLEPAMVDYARSVAGDGEAVTWLECDMQDFTLPRPVDLAICAYDSIDAMLTNDAMVRHLQAVARNLTPGGLYLIQCIHPRDCSPHHYGIHRHTGSDGNGVSVQLRIGVNRPRFDPVTGTGKVVYELRVASNGSEEVMRDEARERLYSPQVLELLVERSGVLEVAGWFGDFDQDQPLDTRSSEMLCLLRRPVA